MNPAPPVTSTLTQRTPRGRRPGAPRAAPPLRGPTRVTPETAAPASTAAPAASTESVTSAPAPTRAPSKRTDRNTLAPDSTTTPAPSTDPSTDAPAATVAPGPMSGAPPLRSSRSALASRYLAGGADVEPVGGGREGVELPAPGQQAGERLPLDRHRPAGRDVIEHRRLEDVGAGVDPVGGASPGGGFSTKRSTRPPSSVGTTPKAEGSSTRVRAIVASASRSSWNRTRAETSRSVRTSPLQTRNRLVTPPASAAKRIAPAVPSGSGSAATCTGRSENDRPAKASDR